MNPCKASLVQRNSVAMHLLKSDIELMKSKMDEVKAHYSSESVSNGEITKAKQCIGIDFPDEASSRGNYFETLEGQIDNLLTEYRIADGANSV